MAEPNLLLEALLARAGISHAGLAKQVNIRSADLRLRYDHASVARWIRDHAIPRDPAPELICRIIAERLGVDVTLADIGMVRGEATDRLPSLAAAVEQGAALWHGDSRGRVPSRIFTGAKAAAPVFEWENPPEDDLIARLGERRVDTADVAMLRRARTHFQEMYRRVGGMPVRPRITALLTQRAAPLLRASYDNALGRQLYRAVGGLAALAGVCAYDANQQPLAQRHLFTALRLAKASGDRQFGAYVVALLANQALYLEERRLVVQYAESALRAGGPSLSPALVTDLHALAGKAYARMGDARASHPHLRTSATIAANLGQHHGHDEVSYVQPGLIETQLAEALRRLDDLPAARIYAEESVRTAGSTHLRGQVHRYAGLALILTAQGELDRGVHVAERMLDRADGMDSGRLHDRVAHVTRALRPHAGEPVVAAYLERADEYLYLKES
ncbi:hypothetical protein [Micromonospora sp. NBC_01813]|uniref:hypothetical protein n=1 Tax=Micromonospora sp. NBC_01813 TaxID=2975988 RepID=UPI002DD9067E|nr:hypothetical protein [Micromonospora sp. NBC_01813]WSA07050.1 hypothetical protein OG958_22670 [Micromonospora sp. NBC_01813]